MDGDCSIRGVCDVVRVEVANPSRHNSMMGDLKTGHRHRSCRRHSASVPVDNWPGTGDVVVAVVVDDDVEFVVAVRRCGHLQPANVRP